MWPVFCTQAHLIFRCSVGMALLTFVCALYPAPLRSSPLTIWISPHILPQHTPQSTHPQITIRWLHLSRKSCPLNSPTSAPGMRSTLHCAQRGRRHSQPKPCTWPHNIQGRENGHDNNLPAERCTTHSADGAIASPTRAHSLIASMRMLKKTRTTTIWRTAQTAT